MQLKIVRSAINSYLLHLANNDKSLVTKIMTQAIATSKNHNDAIYACVNHLVDHIVSTSGTDKNNVMDRIYKQLYLYMDLFTAITCIARVINRFYEELIMDTEIAIFPYFPTHAFWIYINKCLDRAIFVAHNMPAKDDLFMNINELKSMISEDFSKFGKQTSLVSDVTKLTDNNDVIKDFDREYRLLSSFFHRGWANTPGEIAVEALNFHIFIDKTSTCKDRKCDWYRIDLNSYQSYLNNVCAHVINGFVTKAAYKQIIAWYYCKQIQSQRFNSIFGLGGDVAKPIEDVNIDDINSFLTLTDNAARKEPYKSFDNFVEEFVGGYVDIVNDVDSVEEYIDYNNEDDLSTTMKMYPLFAALISNLKRKTDTFINTFDFYGNTCRDRIDYY